MRVYEIFSRFLRYEPCLLLATGGEYPEQDVLPVFAGSLAVPGNASPSMAVDD